MAQWLLSLRKICRQMVKISLAFLLKKIIKSIKLKRNNTKKLFLSSHIHSMLLATVAYIVSILGIILMYIWYTPQPSCLLNIFFITWTLVLLQLMTSVSLHPKVILIIQIFPFVTVSPHIDCIYIFMLNRSAPDS